MSLREEIVQKNRPSEWINDVRLEKLPQDYVLQGSQEDTSSNKVMRDMLMRKPSG